MSHQKSSSKKPSGYLSRAPNRLLGQVRNMVGKQRELAALEALRFNEDGMIPEWIESTSLGTSTEDRAGIDIVVYTDIGKLFLQIKGTEIQVQKFLAKHRKGNIVPFIVEQTSNIQVLREKLIACLQQERARILKLRSHT